MLKLFRGVYTAIVTPFTMEGEIDWKSLENLIERQIAAGIDGIVPCGTTGESPTLSHGEHLEVIKRTVELVDRRCLVIGGTGSNSTREAIVMSQHAIEAGVDACMLVNPYYNKPTQRGLYLHFSTIANAITCPVIVYNIKGRTGVNVETDTLKMLINDCDNIVAVKEASGDLAQIKEVIEATPETFSVLSGDDNLCLETIKLGGDGVISVASNLVPERMLELVRAGLAGDRKAEELNAELSELFASMFLETNPMPIKTALSMLGYCVEQFRLPMCGMLEENRSKLSKMLTAYGFSPESRRISA